MNKRASPSPWSWNRPARAATRRALVALLALVAWPVAALASAAQPASELTLYVGRGVDSDLLELAPKLLRGNADFDDTHFAGIGYLRFLRTPAPVRQLFDALCVPNTRIGIEGVAARHHGLQDNAEIALALALRFGALELGPLAARFGVSLGLSYAIGTPSYEDGSAEDPDRRYRLQNFNGYEVAFAHAAHPHWSLLLRVHHRSGAYGLIAPRHVGSNFVAAGLRVRY